MVGLRLIRARRALREEQGAGIVTALMVTLTVFSIGAALTGVSVHQVESSSFERLREQALHAAEAGLNATMSRLAGDLRYPGTTGPVALHDGTGQYEVRVAPVDPSDPDDRDRYIVATGYAPSKGAGRRAVRQLEQQVVLEPTDGFAFALFSSPGGIIGQNNARVTGNVYSADDLVLANDTNIYGDLVVVDSVSTTNNSLIAGDIHAGGDVTIHNANTTVQGNVYAGGNVTISGRVEGNVQAAGSVTVAPTGVVTGVVAAHSPPPPPPAYNQPSYQWDPANYPVAFEWASASAFRAYWSANVDAMSGAHRVRGGDSLANAVVLDRRWKMAGDVVLVTDGPITLSRDIENVSGRTVTLAVISLSGLDPAILLSNNLTLPSDIRVLLFAPQGQIDFSQLKDFHGAVYGETIDLSQQFTLTHEPPAVAGFSWDGSSATHFVVRARTFREVTAGS